MVSVGKNDDHAVPVKTSQFFVFSSPELVTSLELMLTPFYYFETIQ